MIPLWRNGFMNIRFFKSVEIVFFCILKIPYTFRQEGIFITFIVGMSMEEEREKKAISIYFLRGSVKLG